MARIPVRSSNGQPGLRSAGIFTNLQITNLVTDLPTAADASYPTRPLSQIKQIIIHHSSVSNKIGPARIAKMQVAQGKPAIAYHLFIMADGAISQTNELTTISDHTEGHNHDSIAICFAGNFTRKSPTTAQLQAGNRLIAQLMQSLSIELGQIKGASELSDTQSPGQQWLTGEMWKNRLLRGLQTTPVEPNPTEPTPPNPISPPPNEPANRPNIQNVVDSLARHETKHYPRRNPATINAIVIHHTAVPGSVSAERIARVHVSQGKPAITYHYLVQENGDILQTNLAETETEHTVGHNTRSLAVAFAGNFTHEIPPPQQIASGAKLLAYLQNRFGIAQSEIKGASELVNTQSPGRQWLEGQQWKRNLFSTLTDTPATTEPVTPIIPTPVTPDPITPTPSTPTPVIPTPITPPPISPNPASPNTNLHQQIAELQAKIVELEITLSIAQEASISVGGGALITAPVASGPRVSQPVIQNLIDTLPKHPTNRYQSRSTDKISQIIIHHTAVPASVSAERIAKINIRSNNWPGLGFHYFITADGTLQQTNPLTSITYHAGPHNEDSIGIAFAGDFDEAGAVPTQPQIQAGAQLMAWLLSSLNLSVADIHGHQDYAQTSCPGDQWEQGSAWRTHLLEGIRHIFAGASGGNQPGGKSLYHYLLFWQSETDWAKQDLASAANYLAAFRPTMGFSVDDAMTAAHVTIIGGPLGISAEAEAKIKASGSKVERIAGNSERATKALLDNLARQHKRFLTLEL